MALLDLFRRRRSVAPSDLARFLQSQSAYVAQKTVLDYCRVKAGRSEKQVFSNPDFLAALAHCRWQVFFAALSDVTALIEAHLRPHAPGQEVLLVQRLVALHHAALAYESPPMEQAASGADARDTLPHHLAVLQLEAPQPAHRLPLLAEAVLFATNEDGSASATDWRPGKWSPVHRGFRRQGATPSAFCVWFSARHRLL